MKINFPHTQSLQHFSPLPMYILNWVFSCLSPLSSRNRRTLLADKKRTVLIPHDINYAGKSYQRLVFFISSNWLGIKYKSNTAFYSHLWFFFTFHLRKWSLDISVLPVLTIRSTKITEGVISGGIERPGERAGDSHGRWRGRMRLCREGLMLGAPSWRGSMCSDATATAKHRTRESKSKSESLQVSSHLSIPAVHLARAQDPFLHEDPFPALPWHC